jgi:hypothetical protein
MPFLDKQIALIDKALEQALYGKIITTSYNLYGLANQAIVPSSEGQLQKFPVVYFEASEPRPISIDDTYSMSTYHRLRGTSYEPATQGGDANDGRNQVDSMSMLVYGSRGSLHLSPEALSDAIGLAMPSTLAAADLSGLKIDLLDIVILNRDINSFAVFSEEYDGTEYFIAPESFLFKIDYRIATKYRANCFNYCDCQ